MKQVAGISLSEFEEPIRYALRSYSSLTDGSVTFDVDAAAQLELTPNKPNSARSATTVRYLGEVAGTLHTILFKPGDGTGDQSSFNLRMINTDVYPPHTKVLPRRKDLVHTEGHLTIASLALEDQDADPVLFAGNQVELGLDYNRNTVVKLGELGQLAASFQRTMKYGFSADGTTTLTTGYRDALLGVEGARFGDPHAVYNPHPEVVQVCGFIAIAPEDSEHIGLFRELRAVEL